MFAMIIKESSKNLVKGDPKSMNQKAFLFAICDPSCCIKEPENKKLIGF